MRRLLILAGVFLGQLGLLMVFWHRIPLLGKLPGDIFVQKGNLQFLFPLTTCLVLSVILTVLIYFAIGLFAK